MSVASALTALQADITAARAAVTTKGGTVTPDGGTSQLATDIATIPSGGGGIDLAALRSGRKTKIEGEDATQICSLLQLNFGCYNLFFRNPTTLTHVDLSQLTTIAGTQAANSMFFETTIQSIDLSNLQSGQLYKFFAACKGLQSISMPSLVSETSMLDCFDDCSALKSISIPNLSTISNAFGACLRNTPIETAFLHPETVKNATATGNILGYATSSAFAHLSLSATATDNVHLDWCSHLDSDSVLDVLQHLSTSASGKTCAFGGLTIPSSDLNYAAIHALVESLTNWTITGLTL